MIREHENLNQYSIVRCGVLMNFFDVGLATLIAARPAHSYNILYPDFIVNIRLHTLPAQTKQTSLPSHCSFILHNCSKTDINVLQLTAF